MDNRRLRWPHIAVALLAIATAFLVWFADQQVREANRVTTNGVAAPGPQTPDAASQAPSAPGTKAPPATPPASPHTPGATGQTAVFLGDGYTAGTKGESWSDLVVAERGWREVNLSAPGMGYKSVADSCAKSPCTAFPGQVSKVKEAKPQVVFVMGGAADGRGLQASAVSGFVKSLRTAVPDATIYLVNPVVIDSKVPDWVTATSDAIKGAASANRATYLDIGQPLSGKKDRFDGPAEPTAEGHRAIADAVLKALPAA